MQAAIRHGDHAILEVSKPLPPTPGSPIQWTTLAPRPDADIITFTDRQMAHWLALDMPPGEVMYLDDEGNLGVLVYGATDRSMAILQGILANHEDPDVRAAAKKLGIIGGDE